MTEHEIEQALITKLDDLKYTCRPELRDRAALEQNFRKQFQDLNRVTLTDNEFSRLMEQIITPDVFMAARTLRERTVSSATTARRSFTPWSTSGTGARTPSRWSTSCVSITFYETLQPC